MNQWKLADPARVRTIRYRIAETWDTKVEQNQVYLMCGTSIEGDHVLINPHAVIGYPAGLQAAPVRLRLIYPAAWKVGTALEREKNGAYRAESYDQLVDSPILLGRLSEARTMVTGVPVEIYAYSKTDRIKAPAAPGRDGRHAGGRGPLPRPATGEPLHLPLPLRGPVRRRVGAFAELGVRLPGIASSPTPSAAYLTDIAAHEFFHIVTPLNIHSEIIEHFNFVTPVPSQHLWLYEGTTEWAAHAMQLRAGLKSPEDYLAKMHPEDPDRSGRRSTRPTACGSWRSRPTATRGRSSTGTSTCGARSRRACSTSGCSSSPNGRAGAAGRDPRAHPQVRQAAGVPRDGLVDTLVAMTYPEVRDFFARYVWESREAADQGVLRQARHPPGRGRRRDGRCGSRSIPTPPPSSGGCARHGSGVIPRKSS